jgi:hypothetical protein
VVAVVDPPDGTVIITGLFDELNVATTDSAAVMVTTQAPVPVQAPLHPANVDPSEADCASVTCAPLAKLAEQVVGQLIPAGLLVTVPAPLPASLTVSAKLFVPPPKPAVTDVAAVIVTVQVPVPSHVAFVQPVNVEPVAGVAVKTIWVPLAKFAEHAVGQLIPAGVLVTVPVPVPVRVTVSAKVVDVLNVAVTDAAAVNVTTHAPVPVQAPLQPANVEPAVAT